MRISDCSSDVCSSDLEHRRIVEAGAAGDEAAAGVVRGPVRAAVGVEAGGDHLEAGAVFLRLDLDDAPAPAHQGTGAVQLDGFARGDLVELALQRLRHGAAGGEQYAGEAGGGERAEVHADLSGTWRSEEHTSELPSLMRISYAVFCLKKKINQKSTTPTHK